MVQPSSRNGPWLKRVLIPFWVFQIFIEVVFCIAAVVALSEGFEDDSAQSALNILLLLFCIICLALNITEVVLFCKNNLSPLTYFIFQLVKTIIWTALFISTLRRNAANRESWNNGGELVFIVIIIVIVVLLSFIGSLIYSSVVFHRYLWASRSHRRLGHSDPEGQEYEDSTHQSPAVKDSSIAELRQTSETKSYQLDSNDISTTSSPPTYHSATPLTAHFPNDGKVIPGAGMHPAHRELVSEAPGPEHRRSTAPLSEVPGHEFPEAPGDVEVYELDDRNEVGRMRRVGSRP
ncbi:hypothetical protein MMC20_002444 [Loxospora ochrophaea]|nr:hypothetical protein [Loxospora ochrophaea]